LIELALSILNLIYSMNRYHHCQLGLLTSLMLIAVSCGGGGGRTPPPPALKSIQISPASASVGLCKSQQFTATGASLQRDILKYSEAS
jgi:hypothetical protein